MSEVINKNSLSAFNYLDDFRPVPFKIERQLHCVNIQPAFKIDVSIEVLTAIVFIYLFFYINMSKEYSYQISK